MNNSNCGQLGAIQTRGTCWFYSILNGFILSQDGQKILYVKLKEYYKKLKPVEKAYFDDTINAPCPLKDITKTKEIYFWKFVDQYLCFMSGPREMSLKAGKSANLLGGMSLQGSVAKVAQGGKGAFPQMEIEKILNHVGFKGKYDVRYAATKPVKFDGRKKPQFVVAMQNKGEHIKQYMNQIPAGFLNNAEYAPMCASIIIENTEASKSEMHRSHAVAGYVCNGKGFIYDSNQKKIFRCDWWIRSEMVKTIKGPVADFYSFFKGGQVTYIGYSFAVFARKEFTKDIGPSCLMKYRTNTPETYGINFTDPNAGNKINSKLYNYLAPAERAALKRKWARTEHKAPVYINKATFNSIVAGAKNRNNGVQQVNNLEHAGYKFKHENYNNFAAKLKAKFPNKVVAPAKTYTFTNAKAHLNQFTKSTAAVRKHQYSLVWKGIPMAQRRVLMHWRNKGEWLANNAVVKPKTPSPSPRTKRAIQVKTNFEKYWKAMQPENRQMIRNYVAAYKSPRTNANAMNYMKFGTPSPVKKASPSPTTKKLAPFFEPAKNSNALAAAKRNVNAIKTAKKRKEYRRTRAVNMSQNNWTALVRYIDQKNAEARWARSAKKTVAK
ncbi:hypothetical protein AR679_gp203 [Yellowstone lake phycodnavirus 1]|uniref:hypothetical protein n=1 Tax=Yellowstone lake phycodnavirus 1 TaxID=1586713 RepID=UPI0006EB8550|nr:hypothetical protein AR679_gp203 [Yellowstone lake phycodnavirus 1]BAT22229.1 hypothetical protein [Yellowstone lake phycodnavirus 1]